MADEDNKPLQPTGLLDANAVYFEEVEGEEGLELSLEEDQKLTLAEQKKKYAEERKRYEAHIAFINSGLYNKG